MSKKKHKQKQKETKGFPWKGICICGLSIAAAVTGWIISEAVCDRAQFERDILDWSV